MVNDLNLRYALLGAEITLKQSLTQLSAANLLQRDNLGNTILHKAIINGESLEMIQKILTIASFEILYIKNLKGETPLIMAARGGNLNTVKEILKLCPSDVFNMQDSYGCNALENASTWEVACAISKAMGCPRFKTCYTFVRAIKLPFQINIYSPYQETNFETELRKLIRRKGNPTMSKEKSDKDGNFNR